MRIELADIDLLFKPCIAPNEQGGPEFEADDAAEELADASRVVEVHLSDRKIQKVRRRVIGQANVVEEDLVPAARRHVLTIADVEEKRPVPGRLLGELELDPRPDLVQESPALFEGGAIPVEVDRGPVGIGRGLGSAPRSRGAALGRCRRPEADRHGLQDDQLPDRGHVHRIFTSSPGPRQPASSRVHDRRGIRPDLRDGVKRGTRNSGNR